MDTRYSRQTDLVDSAIFSTPINVIGVGGIGSFTTLALAKMGFTDISVWDYDKLEEHNLPNQFYPVKALGYDKVIALQTEIGAWTGTGIKINGMYTGKELDGLVISAVDTMSIRKLVYDSNRNNVKCKGIIDGRMGGQQMEVYTCIFGNNADRKIYKSTLYSDRETASVPCTQKAVIYNVLTIASWICNQARLSLSGKDYYRRLILDFENMILLSFDNTSATKKK